MTAVLPGAHVIDYIRQGARQRNLDEAAVLSIAQYESAGFSGRPGDNNTSFGPFQLHMGGALPNDIASLGPAGANEWAWSTAGIDYALNKIASVASGKSGFNAIDAISRQFERPADPSAEIGVAWSRYTQWIDGNNPISVNPTTTVEPATSTGTTVTATAGGLPNNNGVRLFSTPFGNINIPTGLIAVLIGVTLLILGAILAFVGFEKPSVTIKTIKAKV